MKERLVIQLDAGQMDSLRKEADRRGVSMAAVVRDAVTEYIARPSEEVIRRALSVVGTFSSGKTDIGVEHDRYLEEAYRDWRS